MQMARFNSSNREGKIRHIGFSECSSDTLRRGNAVHQVAAAQIEYNPWTLDIEGEAGTHLLRTCRDLGVSVIAYSPLGRGFLTGRYRSPDDFDEGDFRRIMPRFSPENFPKNLELAKRFEDLAANKGATPAQVVLAWILAQGEDFHVVFSPERVLTGRVFADLRAYPKLVGGLSVRIAQVAPSFVHDDTILTLTTASTPDPFLVHSGDNYYFVRSQ